MLPLSHKPKTECDLAFSGGLQDQNAKRESPPTQRPGAVFNAYMNTLESC